jgi:hypothetical protein
MESQNGCSNSTFISVCQRVKRSGKMIVQTLSKILKIFIFRHLQEPFDHISLARIVFQGHSSLINVEILKLFVVLLDINILSKIWNLLLKKEKRREENE